MITWTDSYSVKVKEIDEQHKQLVVLVNQLQEAMTSHKTDQVMEHILNDLAAYTVNHFRTEETYFTRFSYPDRVAHKAEHEAFTQQVKNFISEFKAGKTTVSIELVQFLSKWLLNHIRKSDQAYADFLVSKGLK